MRRRPAARRLTVVGSLVLITACGVPTPSPSVLPSTGSPIGVPISGLVEHLPSGVAYFDPKKGLGIGSTGPSDSGSIWRTSDGGASWTAQALAGISLRVITVIPGSAMAWAGAACGEVDAACQPGVLASSDGGATWRRIGNEAVMSLSFADADHGWAISPSEPTLVGPVGGVVGSLLFSGDGGRTWTNRGNPCRSLGMAPVSVSFPDVNRGWIGCGGQGGAGTAAKGVLATVDGGRTWAVRALVDLPGGRATVGTISFAGYLNGIAMSADGVGMAWMDRSGTFRTADAGRTWSQIPPGSPDVVMVASAWLLSDADWFAVALDGNDGMEKLERTDDGGASWQVVAQAPAS